jgi:hypothetical protein
MAGTIITGNGIPLFRLMSLRGRVRLEGLGLKSRGGSVTALVKRELGVKGNRDKVLEALEEAIKKAEADLKSGDIKAF